MTEAITLQRLLLWLGQGVLSEKWLVFAEGKIWPDRTTCQHGLHISGIPYNELAPPNIGRLLALNNSKMSLKESLCAVSGDCQERSLSTKVVLVFYI